jgi:hypothetical protein
MVAVLSLLEFNNVDRRASLFYHSSNGGKGKAGFAMRFLRNPILQQISELNPATQFHCFNNPPDSDHIGSIAHIDTLTRRHLQNAVKCLG